MNTQKTKTKNPKLKKIMINNKTVQKHNHNQYNIVIESRNGEINRKEYKKLNQNVIWEV